MKITDEKLDALIAEAERRIKWDLAATPLDPATIKALCEEVQRMRSVLAQIRDESKESAFHARRNGADGEARAYREAEEAAADALTPHDAEGEEEG